MRGRRDFSRSTYGITSSVAIAIALVVTLPDHDTGETVLFALLLAVSLFALERSSRPGSKWSQPPRMTSTATGSAGTGAKLFGAAVVIALGLEIVSGRLAFGWIGAVVIAVGRWFLLHPEPANIMRQRALAALACLFGVLFIAVAVANYGTF